MICYTNETPWLNLSHTTVPIKSRLHLDLFLTIGGNVYFDSVCRRFDVGLVGVTGFTDYHTRHVGDYYNSV